MTNDDDRRRNRHFLLLPFPVHEFRAPPPSRLREGREERAGRARTRSRRSETLPGRYRARPSRMRESKVASLVLMFPIARKLRTGSGTSMKRFWLSTGRDCLFL
jgi:hypothetical protein